jgi:hypothetical protein
MGRVRMPQIVEPNGGHACEFKRLPPRLAYASGLERIAIFASANERGLRLPNTKSKQVLRLRQPMPL